MIFTELRVRKTLFLKIKSSLLVVASFVLILGNVTFAIPALFSHDASAATLLPAPILDVPTNDLTMNGALVTNKWFPVIGAAKYIYQSYYDVNAAQPKYKETTAATQKSATNVVNGAFWWRVKAVDVAGNEGNWSELWKVTIDNSNSAPVAVINVPINATKFTVQFNEAVNPVEATNPANYFLNNWPADHAGDLVSDATVTYDAVAKKSTVMFTNPAWRILPEQQWGVRNIHDLAGNVLLQNPTVEYSSPMIAPTAPVNVHANSSVSDKNVAWVWDGSTDTDGSGVKGYFYQLLKSGSEIIAPTFTTDLSVVTTVADDGGYQLNVYAIDNAGNQSSAASGGITIDTTAPTITITNNGFNDNKIQPEVVFAGDPVSLAWTTSVSASDVTISDTTIPEPVFTVKTDGTYEFTLTAIDAAGNQAAQLFSFTYKTPAVVVINTETVPIVPEVAPFISAAETTNGTNTTNTPAQNETRATLNTRDVADAENVLGAQTKEDGEVLGTETSAIVASTAQGWKVAGILWYWWALILVGVGGIWWFLAARHKRQAQDV